MTGQHIFDFSSEQFDNMDSNNQRNFIWYLVDAARARESGQEYDWKKFPYEPTHFAGALSLIGSERLTRMAMRMTEKGIKLKFADLAEVAA